MRTKYRGEIRERAKGKSISPFRMHLLYIDKGEVWWNGGGGVRKM